jgi:regulator of protease activity HflC (stomatin/prohibitin superfamily)
MLSQLFEILRSLGGSLAPWIVVDQWQGGVILRFGLFHRAMGPGFHWKFPFAETVSIHSVAVTTTALSAQSVIAPDGKVYTAEGVVRWRVDDIKPFACDIWDSENVVVDSAKSSIFETIRVEGVTDIAGRVTTKSRRTLKKYGIFVEEITITTLAPVKCIRLIGGNLVGNSPAAE